MPEQPQPLDYEGVVEKKPRSFFALWLAYTAAHFVLAFVMGCLAAALPSAVGVVMSVLWAVVILGHKLAGFANVGDGVDYLQWPLIVANSCLYGALFAYLHRRLK